jgi:hypothetical protein
VNDDPLACHCGNRRHCTVRATQEDGLCDICREDNHGHWPEGSPVRIVFDPDTNTLGFVDFRPPE